MLAGTHMVFGAHSQEWVCLDLLGLPRLHKHSVFCLVDAPTIVPVSHVLVSELVSGYQRHKVSFHQHHQNSETREDAWINVSSIYVANNHIRIDLPDFERIAKFGNADGGSIE